MESPNKCTSGGCPLGGTPIAMVCDKADASGDVIVPGPECPYTLLAAKNKEIAAAWVLMGSVEHLVPDDEHPAWAGWYDRNIESVQAEINRARRR